MLKLAAVFVLTTIAILSEDTPLINDVMVLSPSNYKDYKQTTPQLFVLYHKSECPYCEYLKKIFAEIQNELQGENPGFRIALFNTDLSAEIKAQEEIQQWPVAKIFIRGGLFNYFKLQLTKDRIMHFIKSTLTHKKKAQEIADDKTYVQYNNLDYAIVFGFPQITSEVKMFAQDFQTLYPLIPIFFLEVNSKYDALIFPKESAKKSHRLLFKRDFDDGDKTFAATQKLEVNDIVHTIWRLKDPKVKTLDYESADEIFSEALPGLILFDSDLKSSRVDLLTSLLTPNSFDGLRLKSQGTEFEVESLMHYLGINQSDFPCLRIIEIKNSEVSKYRFDGEWNKDSIEQFLSDYKNKRLSPYLKNGRPQVEKKSRVLSVNRDQYIHHSKNKELIFVVAAIAKRCNGCEEIHGFLEATRELLNDKKSFVFASVDLDFNDIDDVDVSKLPIIQIFRDGKPDIYMGNMNKEEFAAFLNRLIDEDL